MSNDVDDFLAHFGVKGMRWGVVNEEESVSETSPSKTPATKVDASAKKMASREKRAEKHDAIVEQYQRRIDIMKARPVSPALQKSRNAQIKQLEAERDKERNNAKNIRDGKLSDTQKKLIIGASIATAALVAYGAYKYTDSGEMHQLMIKGREFATGQQHSWKKNDDLLKHMDADGIMQNVVSKINPDYGKYGTKMNCRRCTFAYEMRRRGFDVKATLSNAATGQDNVGLFNATNKDTNLPTNKFAKIYAFAKEQDSTGPKPLTELLTKASPWGNNHIDLSDMTGAEYLERVKNPFASMASTSSNGGIDKAEAIFKALSQNPNGARGELGVGWSMGGGHSVAWEIINGKPVVFDNQSGEKFDSVESLAKFAKSVTAAGFTRLDNLDLNDDFLTRWVQNV